MIIRHTAKKNETFTLITPVYDGEWSSQYVTGATAPDSEYSQDSGSFSDCTNELTEIGTTGIYSLALTAAEMNADIIAVKMTSTTVGANIPLFVLDTTLLDVNTQTFETGLDLTATMKTSVNTEADTALTDYDAATGTDITTAHSTTDGLITTVDTVADAIKAKTDNLPTDPADQSQVESAITTAHATTDGKIDTVDSNVDAILVDTGTTIPATLSSMSGSGFDTSTDSLEAIRDRGDASWITGAPSGSGSTTFTYTVTDSISSNPIGSVRVWATTDSAGTNTVASGVTNDSGEVTFYLDSGTTYYIWRKRAGYTFSNPDTEVVS